MTEPIDDYFPLTEKLFLRVPADAVPTPFKKGKDEIRLAQIPMPSFSVNRSSINPNPKDVLKLNPKWVHDKVTVFLVQDIPEPIEYEDSLYSFRPKHDPTPNKREPHAQENPAHSEIRTL